LSLTILQVLALLLVSFGGAAVVMTRRIKRQVLVLSFFGMALTILFMTLQAADVALSELAVGSAALPLMLLATEASIVRQRHRRTSAAQKKEGEDER
jgi:energy-converting hydrogenase B subunit D